MILQAIIFAMCLFGISSFTCFAHALAVEVGFDQPLNFVNESVGQYEVCVFLSGQIERNIAVQIINVPANSPGSLNQLKSHAPSVTKIHYTFRF